VILDWPEMWESHMPADNAIIPTLCRPSWLYWQFSGDKFNLPGVYNNAYGNISPVDLNMYNGTVEELYAKLKFVPKGTIPPVDPPPVDPPPVDPPPDTELLERVAHLELKTVELEAENDNLYIINQEQNERIAAIENWIQREL